ncbi:MAG: tetronasin resistance protein, partial [Acholeplasmataceae bacterium]
AIYGDMGSFLESNEFMKEMFTYTGLSIEESFTGTVMMVMIGLVIILPVTIINKLFSEEKGLYLNQIYGTKVKRSEIYFTNIILAIVVSILGIFLSAIGLGGSALSVLKSDNIKLLDFIIIGFNLFPVILFFIGLNSFILGWIPKLSKTIYVYLTYAFFLDYFQTVLDVPNWVIKTAPQSWLPKMPMESFDLKIFLLVFLISVILIILGFVGYKKRDMIESV